jgi:TetR/AcrR family transcriptional regulator
VPASPSRQTRADRTRAQILEAAAERFALYGYDETRLEDVGQDVGIGRSAVLYHFKDKQQLHRAVLDDVFGELLDRLRAALVGTGSLADRVERAVGGFVDHLGRHPTAARIGMREAVVADPALREEVQRQARPFLALLEMIFEEGERTGVFRPLRCDPLRFVSTIAGATLFYVAALPTVMAEMPYDPLSDDALGAHRRDMIDAARRMLGIRGPRPAPDEPTRRRPR